MSQAFLVAGAVAPCELPAASVLRIGCALPAIRPHSPQTLPKALSADLRWECCRQMPFRSSFLLL